MKRFIKKTLFFPIGLILLYAIIYFSYNAYLNNKFNDQNALFVWGDSQAYYGIDVKELSNTLEKKVYTSAIPGAGIYDFLLFTEQVPENSEVMVSVSKLVQIRRKENDFNRTGLSFWALKEMYKEDYSINEIFSIFKLNIKPKRNISEVSKLFAYSDSMEIGLPISHFEDYYREVPTFLEQKQELYLTGIKNLIKKNCKVSFLELPYHSKLVNIESKSLIKKETDEFKYKIGSLFSNFKMDTISLNHKKNVFKDLSHLNSVGAKDLSSKLATQMLVDEGTIMYTVQ